MTAALVSLYGQDRFEWIAQSNEYNILEVVCLCGSKRMCNKNYNERCTSTNIIDFDTTLGDTNHIYRRKIFVFDWASYYISKDNRKAYDSLVRMASSDFGNRQMWHNIHSVF